MGWNGDGDSSVEMDRYGVEVLQGLWEIEVKLVRLDVTSSVAVQDANSDNCISQAQR